MWDCAEIKDIPSFKVRSDDVWVCSFPRSGTTLTQEIVYCIMTLDFQKAKTVDLEDRFPIIDVKDLRYPYYRGIEYLNKLPTDTPRMIKSHFHYFLLPDDITKNKKGKIIYICRNPKAALPSLYRVLCYISMRPAPSLRDYFELFLKEDNGIYAGPWGRHVREYREHRNDANILFLQFEKLIKDRRGTITKIADFLGRNLTDDEIDKVMEHTSIENMKKNNAVNLSTHEKIRKTDKSEGAFINTGLTEGWREDVPDDIQKRVNELIKRELKDTDLVSEWI